MLIVTAVVALLVGLVVRFPATVALDWFAPPQLQFNGVSGSIWHGMAATVTLRDESIEVSPLQWQLRPAALLTGRLSANIEAASANASLLGLASFSLGGDVTLSDARVIAPLEGLTTNLSIGQVFGQLDAGIQELVFVAGWPQRLVGTIDVTSLSYPALGLPELGHFRLICSESADVSVYCDVGDTGGPLEVTGSVILRPDGGYELTGVVKSRPTAPQQLVDGLRFLGQPDAYGYYPIEQTGSLR